MTVQTGDCFKFLGNSLKIISLCGEHILCKDVDDCMFYIFDSTDISNLESDEFIPFVCCDVNLALSRWTARILHYITTPISFGELSLRDL